MQTDTRVNERTCENAYTRGYYLFSAVQCSAVQCSAVRCGAVLCGAVQCDAVRCCAMLCDAVRCCAMLRSAVQCDTEQCCAVRCGFLGSSTWYFSAYTILDKSSSVVLVLPLAAELRPPVSPDVPPALPFDFFNGVCFFREILALGPPAAAAAAGAGVAGAGVAGAGAGVAGAGVAGATVGLPTKLGKPNVTDEKDKEDDGGAVTAVVATTAPAGPARSTGGRTGGSVVSVSIHAFNWSCFDINEETFSL